MSINPRKITVSYPDGKTAAKIVDIVTSTKPLGWGRKSYGTYFREEFALAIKKDLDKMIEFRKNKVFLLEKFPSMSKNTLYLYINQSFRYVLEHMDGSGEGMGNGKYRKLWNEVVTDRTVRGCIILKFRPFVAELGEGEDYVEPTQTYKWRQQINDYIEDSDIVRPLVIENLLLNDKEIEKLKLELEDVPNIQVSITSRKVAIIKVNQS